MAKKVENLEMWREAHTFVLSVYKATSSFPAEEKFGLASQFRRAAVSVPANIAEGFRRRTAIEKARFYNIAEASLEECRYYCVLSRDLGYATPESWEAQTDRIMSLIVAYIRAIRAPDD